MDRDLVSICYLADQMHRLVTGTAASTAPASSKDAAEDIAPLAGLGGAGEAGAQEAGTDQYDETALDFHDDPLLSLFVSMIVP